VIEIGYLEDQEQRDDPHILIGFQQLQGIGDHLTDDIDLFQVALVPQHVRLEHNRWLFRGILLIHWFLLFDCFLFFWWFHWFWLLFFYFL
jgi:hypothetical protein